MCTNFKRIICNMNPCQRMWPSRIACNVGMWWIKNQSVTVWKWCAHCIHECHATSTQKRFHGIQWPWQWIQCGVKATSKLSARWINFNVLHHQDGQRNLHLITQQKNWWLLLKHDTKTHDTWCLWATTSCQHSHPQSTVWKTDLQHTTKKRSSQQNTTMSGIQLSTIPTKLPMWTTLHSIISTSSATI